MRKAYLAIIALLGKPDKYLHLLLPNSHIENFKALFLKIYFSWYVRMFYSTLFCCLNV